MDNLGKHLIEDEPRRHVCDVAGLGVSVTRGWWAQPLGMVLGGQLLGRLFGNPDHHLRSGLGYAAAIAAAGAVHQVGHIASARVVAAPMDTLLVTPIRTYTLYDDTGKEITHDQDVGRAIGGPVASISIGIAALFLSLLVDNRYLRFFGVFSTVIGFGALAPFGGNDGEELFLDKQD